MKGKKNLLILFSCVLTVIIAGLFACTRSAKAVSYTHLEHKSTLQVLLFIILR